MKIPVAQPDPRRVLKAAVFVSFLSLGMPSAATAQEPKPEASSPRHYLGADLFAYVERSEDGLSGQTFGVSGSLGTFLTERLSLEIEAARARFLSAAPGRPPGLHPDRAGQFSAPVGRANRAGAAGRRDPMALAEALALRRPGRHHVGADPRSRLAVRARSPTAARCSDPPPRSPWRHDLSLWRRSALGFLRQSTAPPRLRPPGLPPTRAAGDGGPKPGRTLRG